MTTTLARLALTTTSKGALPLTLVAKSELPEFLSGLKALARKWLETTGFAAEAGQVGLIANAKGEVSAAVLGHDPEDGLWALASAPHSLPKGRYRLTNKLPLDQLALGWALGTYRFDRYTKKPAPKAELVVPAAVASATLAMAGAIHLVRDLVNTPANDLGTDELVAAGLTLAKQHGAKTSVIRGDALLKANYPTIHAVGRASTRPPQLLDVRWGKSTDPKLTIVGKGVVFDTGGLDLKPADGMLLMKKDMGGAAHALALAHLIMTNKLPVSLRVLIPTVENSVSGNAFRPLDVITTRSGKTVEIGNTDAEGRLILCDALTEAASEKPDLIIDFATLTGAAWTAIGPHFGVFFANDSALARALREASVAVVDPLWQFPLWQPYAKSMKSKVADLSNTGTLGTAGAVTAALFLEAFIPKRQAWAHFDIRAWNASPQPGRPEGGEAMGLRATYAMLQKRYGR